MKKRVLILFFTSLISIGTYATHIIGGTINYKYLQSSGSEITYSITIEIFRDCYNGDPAALASDSTLLVGIYDNDTKKILHSKIFELTSVKRLSNCNWPNRCTELFSYQMNIVLKYNSSGYLISYERCCRINTVFNLLATNQGMRLISFIPPMSVHNNSPVFNTQPTLVSGTYKANFDLGATDADNDSLVYELVAPYIGASTVVPRPEPLDNYDKPSVVNYKSGFSPTQPFGTSGTISIDPATREINFNCKYSADYAMCVEIKEYRKGVLIGITRRDCPYALVSDGSGTKYDGSLKLDRPAAINKLYLNVQWQICQTVDANYVLERRENGSPLWTRIHYSNTNEPYKDTVKLNTRYYYRVKAAIKGDTIISNTDTGSIYLPAVSIRRISSKNVKVYPNPFKDHLKVEMVDGKQPISVQIFNNLGQIVDKSLFDTKAQTINTSGLPLGLYTIEISDSDGRVFRHLMVKLDQ